MSPDSTLVSRTRDLMFSKQVWLENGLSYQQFYHTVRVRREDGTLVVGWDFFFFFWSYDKGPAPQPGPEALHEPALPTP